MESPEFFSVTDGLLAESNYFDMCIRSRWDEVKKIMLKRPSVIWGSRDCRCISPTSLIVGNANFELLELMASLIYQQPREQHEHLLRKTFERSSEAVNHPIHAAANKGDIRRMEFLVKHCPSGPSVLEVRDSYNNMSIHEAIRHNRIDAVKYIVQHAPSGCAILDEKQHDWTTAHLAAIYGSPEMMEFILRNAPSGIKLLEVKDIEAMTPLEHSSATIKKYFTPQKIRQIGLENERKRLEEFLGTNSLTSLIFNVISEDIETRVFQS